MASGCFDARHAAARPSRSANLLATLGSIKRARKIGVVQSQIQDVVEQGQAIVQLGSHLRELHVYPRLPFSQRRLVIEAKIRSEDRTPGIVGCLRDALPSAGQGNDLALLEQARQLGNQA